MVILDMFFIKGELIRTKLLCNTQYACTYNKLYIYIIGIRKKMNLRKVVFERLRT